MSTDIKELENGLREMQEEFERIASEPLDPATVVSMKGNDVRVATGGGHVVIKKPLKNKLKPGDAILLNKQSLQFIRENPFANDGYVATVSDILGDEALIEVNGRMELLPAVADLKSGDKVVLDQHSAFIVRVLPRKDQGYSVPETNIVWDDIGGNELAKEAMIEAIENPHKYGKLYEFYGTKGAKGLLLYGPPGCGKTMLGKAAASSIGSAEGFIYCKGPEVLDPYVGVAEATVRSLFSRARMFKEETGHRAVIFIDEAEALLGRRGARNSFMEKTIVPTFLAEMDGVDDSGAVVILATNQNLALDPAVVRDGRIDRKIEISRPGERDSVAICLAHLKRTPIAESITKQELAEHIVKRTWEANMIHAGREVPVRNFVSGSLFAGIIDKAKTHAMRRDIANGTQTGICLVDCDWGMDLTISEMGATSLETL